MCNRNTNDALARRLYRDEGLCLLKVARAPAELHPGSMIVTFPDLRGRDPVIHVMDKMLVNAPAFTPTEIEYLPITLTESSSSVSADAMADVSGLVGAGDKVAFKGALMAGGSQRFKVLLTDGRRADLAVGAFELDLQKARFSEAAKDFVDQGCGIYVVTRTVTSNELEITGDKSMSAAAFGQLTGVLTSGLKIKSRGDHAIRMNKADSEMVIGFQALKIMDVDGRLRLNGMERRLDVRGGGGREGLAVFADASEFSGHDDEIFASPDVAGAD